MTEEQQQPIEKKKGCIYWRILKWAGLVLLSLLLLIALVFQAPWKVTALLAIFLLACTALPKPYRKYFWTSIAVIVIILIIWVFLPTETESWKPFTFDFDEEIAALNAKYAIPDSENAACIYYKLSENLNLDSNAPEFFNESVPSSTSGPWQIKDHPEMAKWLKKQQNSIDLLSQAAKFEKCHFPVNNNLESKDWPDRRSGMRKCAFLLVCVINNDFAEGRIEEALEKLNTLIQMGEHLHQEPSTLDILTGITVKCLAIEPIKQFVVTDQAKDEYITLIEDVLTKIKYDTSYDVRRNLEWDKSMDKSDLNRYYEINEKGKTRLNRDPSAKIRKFLEEAYKNKQNDFHEIAQRLKTYIFPNYWQKKLIKANTIISWFFLPSTPQKAAKMIDDAFEKYYATTKPDFDWTTKPKKKITLFTVWNFIRTTLNFRFCPEYMAYMNSESYYRVHDLYLRMLSTKRGCLLLVALRRYKNKESTWPNSLEQIKNYTDSENFIDPINDGSFVYKLTDDNFTLYSKGKNNIDEDGEYETKWDPNTTETKVLKDDRLIWPIKSCETQEENNNDG